VVNWRIVYTAHACRDAKKIVSGGLKPKVQSLLDLLAVDPFRVPPRFEWLVGDISGAYSRRINIHNRLVYQVLEDERVVKVLRMWTHYD
jgi:Txe/YoeB family toxin of toxin-antitoxin system